MNTNVLLTLDKRYQKKDGTRPIILRISHNQRNTSIKTGFSVLESFWNIKKTCIKPSYKGTTSVARLNNLLAKKKAEAIDTITKLEDLGKLTHMTVKQIKENIVEVKKAMIFIVIPIR